MASKPPSEALSGASAAPAKSALPRKKRRRSTALIVFVFHLLGALSSVDAVMSVRTSQGAIAWAVSLNTFPYLAVPTYWVLGRSRFHGYVIDRRGKLREIAGVTEEASVATREFLLDPGDISAATQAAHDLVGISTLRGNAVELLIDGDETFTSLLAGIDAAQEYILFQFYIVHDDEIGREVKAHLIERARAGVRVTFLYDEIGSSGLPQAYLDELREAGVDVSDFNTQKGTRNRFQLNFRNHRKVLVVDGHFAWVGGLNVGDEYLGRDPEFGNWRDTHLRIEGPAALAVQVSFLEDWHWATGRPLELNWIPRAAQASDIPVLIAPTGPADELETASLMFVHAINSAKQRVWIATPYFVPDEPVVAALQLASLRGLDVRILIPDEPDNIGVGLASYALVQEAGRTGAKFYRYTDGFLHQKVMLVDDILSCVGTANFDNRSFRLNFEITALVGDEDFASQVEQMLVADFARSRPMESDEYLRKPWWFRFGVRVARLTAPVQ